jgi:prepilin-type processing-associated H-X9-DG protein
MQNIRQGDSHPTGICLYNTVSQMVFSWLLTGWPAGAIAERRGHLYEGSQRIPAKRFHINRIVGGHCNHSGSGGDAPGALAGAKRQALSAVCKNHLHEMGLALRMYVDDTKFYPYYLAVGKTDGDGYFRWPQYLQPYYQLNWTNPAYHCPAYNGAVESLSSYGSVQILGSYSYNYLGAEGGLGDTGFFGESYLGIGTTGVFNEGGFPISPARPDTQVVTPADTYAIMDTAATIRYGSLYLSYFPDLYWTGSGSSGVDWAGCIDVDFQFFAPFLFQQNPKTHGQSFNVLYCDGHVTPVRLTD